MANEERPEASSLNDEPFRVFVATAHKMAKVTQTVGFKIRSRVPTRRDLTSWKVRKSSVDTVQLEELLGDG